MTSTASAGRKKATRETTPRTTSAGKAKAGAREKPATAARGKKGRAQAAPGTDAETKQRLHLHTAHPSIPVPYVTREDMSATVRAAESALPSVTLPPPERLAFYGGLGVLAVAGAVDWPVAAAIGVGTAVARRGRRRQGE